MRVHWTENAIGHLVNIYEYIAINSPTYAKRMVDKITIRSQQIEDYPMSVRKVPEVPHSCCDQLFVHLTNVAT